MGVERKAKMGVGREIDPGLMSCHALRPWNALMKHVRLWRKSNKGKSHTSWNLTWGKAQTFGLCWGLVWKQNHTDCFHQLILPSGWWSDSKMAFWDTWSWLQLLYSCPCKMVTVLPVCLHLFDGFPWVREDKCLCGNVGGRCVSLVSCPGNRNDCLLLNLTKL